MSINPYQPPETTPATEAVPATWEVGDEGPIRFSGEPSDQDLDRYLSSYDNVGCIGIGLCVWVVVFALGWLAFSDLVGVSSIVIGIALIVCVTGLVSSRFYRRMSFLSMNPDWQSNVDGEIRADGVLIQRDHSCLFVRWGCLIDVVAGQSVVGLHMMPHVSETLIVGEEMLERPVNEQRVNQFVQQIRRQLILQGSMDTRRYLLNVLLKEKRERTIRVPENAIAFSGSVFRNELNTARANFNEGAMAVKSSKWLRHSRPLAVVASLVLGAALILGGVLHAILPQDPLLAHTMTYGILAIGWISYRMKAKREKTDAVIQYLNAFADEDGVTSDGGVIITALPWSHIKQTYRDPEKIVLRHSKTRRVMVVRRDMFTQDSDWSRFLALADR